MEKFDAQGQIVYVEEEWVTGDTCLFNIKNPFEYATAKSKLTKIRKEFLNRLEQEGFIISYDNSKIDENNAVCLIMDDTAICNENIDIKEYKKAFDKRIFESGGEKLNYPHSVTIEEYFENPFFPAVLKNELQNGGVDKFLIETEEQLEKIKKFYNDFYKYSDYYDEFNCSIFQQLIETPTKYQTYMRVLMSTSGDVMGASLKYSKVKEQKRNPIGMFEKHFWNENSQYYLNCNGMFNYYSEGGNITFTQPSYSNEKKAILEAHNIDSNSPSIPEDVLEVASSIAKNCNRELGIMCGIDFIYNEKDKKWYYLEVQAFPAIEEWAVTKGVRLERIKSTNDYIKYCAIELEARYDALMMYMKNKLSNTNNDEQNPKIRKLEVN